MKCVPTTKERPFTTCASIEETASSLLRCVCFLTRRSYCTAENKSGDGLVKRMQATSWANASPSLLCYQSFACIQWVILVTTHTLVTQILHRALLEDVFESQKIRLDLLTPPVCLTTKILGSSNSILALPATLFRIYCQNVPIINTSFSKPTFLALQAPI